jgi:anti-sigma B factor antagonist
MRTWVNEVAGRTTVVQVAGDVDAATVDILAEQLSEVCARVVPPHSVVVDLRRVEFVSSAGLASLVDADTQCRSRDVEFRVVANTRAVTRPLQVTGLDRKSRSVVCPVSVKPNRV